jgi:hypothetical protein
MKDFKVNKVSLIIVVVIVGVFLIELGKRYDSMIHYQGEWSQYDSQEYSQASTFPDGFRLDYPANWEVSNLRKGGTKNLRALRVSFFEPNYIFIPSTYLQIWWHRVDTNWTLDDVKEWYVNDIAFGVNRDELEQKRDGFSRIKVGVHDYPALVQTFKHFEGKNPRRQVVLLLVGDEAFAFSFHTNDYNEDIAATFERMIATLEIYR